MYKCVCPKNISQWGKISAKRKGNIFEWEIYFSLVKWALF